jgi:hypothetical protein
MVWGLKPGLRKNLVLTHGFQESCGTQCGCPKSLEWDENSQEFEPWSQQILVIPLHLLGTLVMFTWCSVLKGTSSKIWATSSAYLVWNWLTRFKHWWNRLEVPERPAFSNIRLADPRCWLCVGGRQRRGDQQAGHGANFYRSFYGWSLVQITPVSMVLSCFLLVYDTYNEL